MYKETFKMIDGDMVVGNDFELVTGQEGLRQNIENRYAINKGEWFLDTELGLDYSLIRGKGVTDSQVELAIRECGLQDDRIEEVINVSVARDNGKRYAAITFDLIDKEENYFKQEVIDIE